MTADSAAVVDDPDNVRKISRVVPLMKAFRYTRRNGSAALDLSYVASGAVEAYVDVRDTSTPENYMAGHLLIVEAGGKLTDWEGRPIGQVDLTTRKSYVGSANPMIHERILSILDRSV